MSAVLFAVPPTDARDVRRGVAGADRRRAGRLLRPGAAGDAKRPAGRTAHGIESCRRYEAHPHGFPTHGRTPLDPPARRGAAPTCAADPAPDDVRPGGGDRSVCRRRGVCLEGRAIREAAGGRAALEGAGRPGCVDLAASHAAVRQCLLAGGPALWTGSAQHLRRHDRHLAWPDGRGGGLPLPEHLAAGHRRDATPRHRLGARRQQHLGLHRRPGVRRREPGADRQRRHRHRELPARRHGLLQSRHN